MLRHRGECQRKFKEDAVEWEHTTMRERSRQSMRYRSAVREALEHESKLVKKDHFVPQNLALRILAI
jgi:hypothetical protein